LKLLVEELRVLNAAVRRGRRATALPGARNRDVLRDQLRRTAVDDAAHRQRCKG
jgi:hypothetical protein